MDEDLNSENSNSSAKRSKLDNDNMTEENDSSMSNANEKIIEKSIPMETVPNNGDEESVKNQEISTKNDTQNLETDIDTTSDISRNVTSDKKDEENNSTSESPKENDKINKSSQNSETEKVVTESTENIEKNYPSTSTSTSTSNEKGRNDKNLNNKGVKSNEDENTKTAKIKRKNYRTRPISSSSDESDSDNGQESNLNPAVSNSAAIRQIFDTELSSSSDSEPNTNSGRHDDDSDSTSVSFTYPEFDTMDYDDSHSYSSSSNKEADNDTVQEILQSNKKPNYNWSSVHEIMYREHGLSGNGGRSMVGRNAYSFQSRFYSARHVVEKMKLLHQLEKHQGCVNSLNFNRAGTLLVSGSDDLKIIVWKWASNKIAHGFRSGHISNVFQTKFIDLSSGINIVSSGRDGQVRHATIPPSGGKVISSVLLRHDGAVHKIALTPQNPYEILTAGEDGHVVRFDLRERPIERLVTVKLDKRRVPLYSIAHHPFEPEFCVCGRNQFVYVYDKRNPKKPTQTMCPKHLEDKKSSISHITCAVYNNTGTEILASYSDEDIYLFNNKCYIPGRYLHQYRGHNNIKTIKGVNFYGLNSEYIVSGSDCGNFFIWEKETESIINWTRGDRTGVINCLEPHPSFPVLATSGIDPDVKIWVPLRNQYPPSMVGLERCVRHNIKRSVISNNLFDDTFDDRTLFFFVHQCLRSRRTAQNDENCPNVHDLVSSSSSDDDERCETDEENLHLRTLPCSPQ